MTRLAAGTAGAVVALTLAVAVPARADVVTDLDAAVTVHHIPGAIAVIRDGATVTRHTAGFSDVDTQAGFAPETHVRAASITKSFVAATVLQLVAEGRIDLDSPVETYLPGRVHGDGIDGRAITVRQLLRHQSGLPEYFDDADELPAEPQNPDQMVDAALAKPALFAPGTQMRYTNTNYILAGLIIEAITGQPAVDEINRRILLPLGLFHTYFPAPGDNWLRSPMAHGYEEVDGEQADVTDFPASDAGLSGSLVSTGEDTTAFITAMLDGRVVPRAQLDQMMDTVPMPGSDGAIDYGLGLMKVSLPCGVMAWGHGGDIPGYHSFMAKTFDGPAISVTLTQDPDTASPASDPRIAMMDSLYCAGS